MARAKKALSGLPWVDQNSVSADVTTQKVTFGVSDMSKFDEKQLSEAFRGVNFNQITVVSRPKAPAAPEQSPEKAPEKAPEKTPEKTPEKS